MTARSGGEAPLIAALAGGAAVAEAARTAGISERTAFRRLEDPAFRQQVDEARAALLGRAVAMLTSAAVEAVETLRGLLASDADFAKLAAARSILELGCRLREQLDLAERLAAIERTLEARS